jgi:carboxypeptidase Taq
VEQYYQAINLVEPSLIRVEADEVTYNLHIFLRFDLERELLSGQLAVKDLPQAWNDRMEEYLGIRPENDADGVMQDVHWSAGLMGYFPTYALGNLLSVQFYRQAEQAIPDLETQISNGDFRPLREWLTENIYRHGRKLYPADLVKKVTGEEISAGPFLEYARDKFGKIYQL